MTLTDELSFYRDLFQLFSIIYLEVPTPVFLDNLISQNPFDTWPVESSTPELPQGLSLLQTCCARWTPDRVREIELDYTRLFIGLDRTLAPPYESVFLSEEHLLFEKPVLEVRRFYQRYHLEVPHKNRIPDDHLGYELQFISRICGQMDEGGHGIAKDALRFLDDHLLKWIDEFTERVNRYAETDFYRGMALITRASLMDLRVRLQKLTAQTDDDLA